MPRQLKGVLFDFDDTLIDWSGVRLSWYDIEAPLLTRVHAYVNARLHRPAVDFERLIELYQKRTMQAWGEARMSLRAPHMPNILFATMSELGIDCDQLDTGAVLRAYNWNVVPGTVVFPDVCLCLRRCVAPASNLASSPTLRSLWLCEMLNWQGTA